VACIPPYGAGDEEVCRSTPGVDEYYMHSCGNGPGGVSISIGQYESGQLPVDGRGKGEWWNVIQPEFGEFRDYACSGRKFESRGEFNDKSVEWYIIQFRWCESPGRNQERWRHNELKWNRGQYFGAERWGQVGHVRWWHCRSERWRQIRHQHRRQEWLRWSRQHRGH